MSIISMPSASERAWVVGERQACSLMGQINAATAGLVDVITMMIETNGWTGPGMRSVEHWVTWKAAVSTHRADGLVAIARRREELPACWALFAEGRLSEDAMVRIARRVPAERDEEVARRAPTLLIPQLTRALAALPELVHPDAPEKPEPMRMLSHRTRQDGWLDGTFSLPPDEGALVLTALIASRDAEFRDREDLDDSSSVPANPLGVSWADGLVRMASEACDALDATFRRTGHRGERHQVVIHRDLCHDGALGPARLHLGGHIEDRLASYLGCDAQVIIQTSYVGRVVGINPAERTPNRRFRRYLEHRDGGCAHPLCTQKRWLHLHHLLFWEDGGLTVAENLVCLCPRHHRGLHMGDFTITGDPEAGDLAFTDKYGLRIEPPPLPPQPPPDSSLPTAYAPPPGEPLSRRWFGWSQDPTRLS